MLGCTYISYLVSFRFYPQKYVKSGQGSSEMFPHARLLTITTAPPAFLNSSSQIYPSVWFANLYVQIMPSVSLQYIGYDI